MADPLEQSRESSVQDRARGGSGVGVNLLLWMGATNELAPPWWSRARDGYIRDFWKQVDYLAGAVYTLESRMKTVPFRVHPKNQDIKAHVQQAERFQEMLEEDTEFGAGWGTYYSKWVEDLTTQDNGAFSEVIGEGKPDGPIIGAPLTIANLDAALCMRTSDPEFPVIYTAPTGKRHKLHHTRVMFTSQMTSPIERMHGVGFCAVSRCLNVAQSMMDILIYKQEKLGSRPQRSVWVTQGGLDPEDVRTAFHVAEETMDNQLLRRYAKTVVVGADTIPDANIQDLDLAGVPDGFDEQTSITLGMSTISLAFGVDPRELFPGLQAGATRAEALIAHIKQRGKGPGDILKETERQINAHVMPPTLTFSFDFQDDEQDRNVAEIRKTRADYLVALGGLGLLDERAIREQMLEDGDLSREQFERMELKSGRLPDGSDLLNVFHDPEMAELLDLGVDMPLDTDAHEAADMLRRIEEQRAVLVPEIANAVPARKRDLLVALAALDRLRRVYGGLSAEMAEEAPTTRAAGPPADAAVATEEDTAAPPPFSSDDLDLKAVRVEEARAVKAAAEAVIAAAGSQNGRPLEDD